MDNKHAGDIPQVIELPLADYSEHDEIIYWHTEATTADGGASSVHLKKSTQLIEFEVWQPYACWQPGSGLKPRIGINPDDLDRAALKAYEDLTVHQRETKDEATVHIRMQGYPNGVRVVMKRGTYRYEQPCWRDESGRVW
jgi:hypothetical protein